MKKELLAFKEELQEMLDDGMSLTQIAGETYKRKEAGSNIILWMRETTPNRLTASPEPNQKKLFKFLNEVLEDEELIKTARYRFFIEGDTVHFQEVTKKGNRLRVHEITE